MGWKSKLLGVLRFGAALAGAKGLTVKGVPIAVIAEEAEKAVAATKASRKKPRKKPAPKNTTGE